MAVSQKELLNLYRAIARNHRFHLGPVLGRFALGSTKESWLKSFNEFNNLKSSQEKEKFVKDFIQEWKEYMEIANKVDPHKDLAQYVKVALDPEGKEKLFPSFLSLKYIAAAKTPEQKKEMEKISDKYVTQKSEELRKWWRENEHMFFKNFPEKEIQKRKELAWKSACDILNDAPGSKEIKPEFMEILYDKASRPEFQPYVSLLYPRGVTLTPDQVKKEVRKIEVPKMTPEEMTQLTQISKEILFSNKTEEEKQKIENKLKDLNEEERAAYIEAMMISENTTLEMRHEMEQLQAKYEKASPEEKKKMMEEHINNAKISLKQRQEMEERYRKTFDPNGEMAAKFNSLSPEERKFRLKKFKEVTLPNAWNSFISKLFQDPEVIQAKSDPLLWKEWLNKDDAELEKENQRLEQLLKEKLAKQRN